VKRLLTDMRLVKDKVMDGGTGGGGSARGGLPGDHAMLAGRPIMGYRCM
jgi:hypothetical protein